MSVRRCVCGRVDGYVDEVGEKQSLVECFASEKDGFKKFFRCCFCEVKLCDSERF
jgi:hypothetical protein